MISTYPMKRNVFKIPQSAQHLVHQQFRHWVETIWWMFWNEHGGTFPLYQMMMTKIYHLLNINCLIWIYELYHIRHLSNFIALTVRAFPRDLLQISVLRLIRSSQSWPRAWRALLNIYRFFLGQAPFQNDYPPEVLTARTFPWKVTET